MSVKCPKCEYENTSDSKFCKECGSSITVQEKIPASHTKTMETPKEGLMKGITFANRYEIIEELGRGGMGRVYKALDKEINEEVAVKLLKAEIAEDESTIERFRNELKVARKIAHKNVCKMTPCYRGRNTLHHHGICAGREPERFDSEERKIT